MSNKVYGFSSWNIYNQVNWLLNDEQIYNWVVKRRIRNSKEQTAKLLFELLKGKKTPDGVKYNITGCRELLYSNFD